jgi:hypothetical protein
MAILKKTLFPTNLDKYSVLVDDTDANSKYFNITELPNTLTGGKNAFLIAGSEYLVPDTLIKIEVKDSNGDVIYHEPGEGMISASFNSESFVTQYYEGVSKVVAVYIYPETSYGPCTITILGELKSYIDANGNVSAIPTNWTNTYNVKWQKQVNVNPSLPNTTKIRFYKRPAVTITEILNPIYKIENNIKVASAVTQSFANIKLSQLETFAGDVKRVKVFRTSLADISDYSLIQDILVESKELLTTYNLTGSVVGNTGIFTSETLTNFWNTGSLYGELTSSRVESGLKISGSGLLKYSQSIDFKAGNTYELSLNAFYSGSTINTLTAYIASGSNTSSVAVLNGIPPTKNLNDSVYQFRTDLDYISGSLFFSQSNAEWHIGNVSLKLSQDTAFSPDEISFVTSMPTLINDETFNFKFEFYDVNNNYVPVFVTQSAAFKGGNAGATAKLLTFQTDRSAFRFSTGSYANPSNQTVKLSVQRTNLTGSVTYASSAFDTSGNYIIPSSYAGTYPGTLSNVSNNGALLSIANFSGSVTTVLVGSIVYTASCEEFTEYETIYRFEDGDNAPGVFVTANANQFIYKATDLSLNPTGQIITIEAKRKNLASLITPLTVNSGSGKPPLTFVTTNPVNGVNTYTLAGTAYPYTTGETTYYISGSDQFGNQFTDSIKISPVKILDGFSVAVSNENTSFPAYSIGTVVGGFAASSGSITVKVGNEVIGYSSPIANNTFSASISAYSGLTPNTFNGTSYSINALSADSGSLTLLVKYQDGGGTIISASKDITYSKTKVGTPNIVVAVSPTSQTLVVNSRGSGSATPATLSVTALEGGTSRFTSIGSPTYTNGLSGTVSTNTIIFTSNASSMSLDYGSITIPVNYTDSEGTTGTKNIVANISKAKAAAPTTLATLSSETQTILSSSAGYAAPATFTISVNEGGSNYSYDAGLTTNNTYYVSSITGGSNSTGTITPSTPSTNVGTTVSMTISYKNSEGTTGAINKTHKVAVSLEGIKGTNGSTGNDGKRTATGMIHYQLTSATAPATPSATSYTFSTGLFAGLTANWAFGAPTYASGNSNKYWYSVYTTVETTAGGDTSVPSFGTPTQAIGFSGLVSFTTANNVSDGSNTLSFGVAGATLINGSNISTGIIKSTNFVYAGADTDASGSYMVSGSIFNLDNGRISTPNFYVDSSGNAFFKGNISIGSGNSIFKADSNGIYLGNATFGSAPFRVTPAGVLNATGATISGTLTITNPSTANNGNPVGQFTNGDALTSGTIGGASISSTKIYIGTGTYGNTNTAFYVDNTGQFSLKDKLTFDTSGNLTINGTINITGGNAATNDSLTGSLNAKYDASNPTGYQSNSSAKTSGSVGGWSITSAEIQGGSPAGGGNGSYTTQGIRLGATGYISAKQFYIDTSGNASFSGSITGGTIAIGSNFSVSNTGIINAAGAILSGSINATGGNIGGWVVDGVILRDTNSRMKLNPTTPGLEIYDTSGNRKVDIKQGALSDPASSGTYSVGGNGASIVFGPFGNTPTSGNSYVSTGYNTLTITTAGNYKVAASPSWSITNANYISFSGGTIYGSAYATAYLAFCTTSTYSWANVVANITIGQTDVINNGTYGAGTYFAMNTDNSQYTVSLPATTLYVFTVIQFIGYTGASGVFGINTTTTPYSRDIVLQLNQIEITDEGMLVVAGANNYTKISRTTSSDMIVVKQDSTTKVAVSAANAQGTGYAAIKTTAGDINAAGRLYGQGYDTNPIGYGNQAAKIITDAGARKGEIFLSTSTRRHKKHIIDWEKTSIIEKIKLVQPKTFRYKNWPDDSEITLGLIAEDLRDSGLEETAMFERDENRNKTNEVSGIDWEKISVVLWKGIQELTQRVEQLENKISGSI